MHSTPVDVVSYGGHRWLVAPYGETNWVRNVRAAGRVDLTRGRRSESVEAIEVGVDEAVPVLRTYLREVAVTRPYFDVKVDSADEAFAAIASTHPVFRVIDPTGLPQL
jgi:hypothetical protein